MTKISKETYPGISKEERRKNLAKGKQEIRINKQTGQHYTAQKRQTKKK